MRSVVAGIIFSVGLATTAWGQSVPAPSIWKNQSNSILEVESVDSNGVIKGAFTNHADKTECQGVAFPVEGHTLANGFFCRDLPAVFHSNDVARSNLRKYNSN